MNQDSGKPAILIASGDWPAAEWAAAILAVEPDRPVTCWPDAHIPQNIRYLLGWKSPPEALAGLTGLEAIFSLGAGVDHLLDRLSLPDVPLVRVINTGLTARMTEWITLQVLLHHRQQRDYDRLQSDRVWKELPQPAAAEVRVGIMGFGVLGADAAEVLARLGFQVAGWSRTPRVLADVEMFHGSKGLDPFLQRTDILVCLLPLTPDTRGILAKPLFSKLARSKVTAGPVLINAGRGGLQIEGDIGRALADGTLAGASLDVFATEPLERASPLWQQPNSVITPHVAAFSAPHEVAAEIHAQILAFEAGRPLQGIVDRDSGY